MSPERDRAAAGAGVQVTLLEILLFLPWPLPESKGHGNIATLKGFRRL